jgi:hypothetical protein
MRKVENKMLQVNVTEEKALRIAPLAVGPLNQKIQRLLNLGKLKPTTFICTVFSRRATAPISYPFRHERHLTHKITTAKSENGKQISSLKFRCYSFYSPHQIFLTGPSKEFLPLSFKIQHTLFPKQTGGGNDNSS